MRAHVERFLARTDAWIGEQVTHQVRAHHRRRLQHIGRAENLDAGAGGWASGGPPPRPGNSLEVLIDGATALPRIAAELERARSHVHMSGWYFSPDFALTRGQEPIVLRNVLARLAERLDVRVLVWAGAPLPLFRPHRSDVREMRDELTAGTNVRCALDSRERPLHCHHEKTIVIDDRVAFVGGIDLTYEAGDRFDSSEHPSRAAVGWHDACARIEGPAVADVAEHFRMRWREVTGETLPPASLPEAAGDVEVQIVRTVPERIYRSEPRGDFRILESYLRALRSAERLVYLESQFLWSPEVEAVLCDKLARPPTDAFRLLVVLPAKPNNGADDTRGVLGQLVEADAGAGRFLACTLYARSGSLSDPIYVHAKVAIVDDRWLTLGSANLNEHSFFNDTEVNVVTHDSRVAKETRLRLWSEHLELRSETIPADTTEAIEALWKPIGGEQLRRLESRDPLTHRLVALPGVSRRSRRLLGPLNGLLVDG